ncbi:AMP-binding protein [Rhodococcus gordoniae]
MTVTLPSTTTTVSGISKDDWVLGAQLRRHAAERPDAPFLTFEFAETLTFAQTLHRSERLAAGLAALGVTHGDRVVMLMDNSTEIVLSWFASNLLGAAEVPINTAYQGMTLEHTFNNCGAKVAVVDARYLPRLAESAARLHHLEKVVVVGTPTVELPWPTIAFDEVAQSTAEFPDPAVSYRDLAAIMYTSGTTGPSKGVLTPHALAFTLGRQTMERLSISAEDTYYVCLPLFHSNAQYVQVYAALIAGAQIAVATRFSASRWLDDIRRSGATVSSLLGVMAQFLYAQPAGDRDRDHLLRRVVAIPMPSLIAGEFTERFNIDCVEAYGMTEASLVMWRPEGTPLRPGSCGKPLSDEYDVAILDPDTDEPVTPGEVGEIAIRPKRAWTMAVGYHDMPEQTIEAWRNLWFHTGDAGRVDEDGYYYFVDRIRDRIRRRGENVSSFDIEAVLSEYPGVVECAAVGVPADEGDDEIKVSLVSTATVDHTDLIEHCRKRLPYFAVPRYVEVLDALPKTPNGKVLKREIRNNGITGAEWDRVAAGIVIGRNS